MLRELGHKVTGRGSRPSSGSRDERSRSRDEKSPARGLLALFVFVCLLVGEEVGCGALNIVNEIMSV